MKSRPRYTGLHIKSDARRHVFALEGEGALALTEQFTVPNTAAPAAAEILYVAHSSRSGTHEVSLRQLRSQGFWQAPSVPTLLTRLRGLLATATMGTQLYVAGTEGFIGQVLQVAMERGIDPHSVLTEHRGSLARRVQCVHCKGITENVTASPFACSHCSLVLFVRDHYSRRIGAFMGVNVDAEVPGEVPPAQELYR